MKKRKGRKPIITGLDSQVLGEWLKDNKVAKTAFKCQALIALKNGQSVSDICKVLNVTRESIRIWRNQFISQGINGLVSKHNTKGRKTFLTNDIKSNLQEILRQSPENLGYVQKQWDGKLVVQYLQIKWNVKISVRTAQNWINKLGVRKEARKRIVFK